MAEADESVVVVTARFLDDGTPAYLKTDGTWSRSLQDAAVLPAEKGELEATTRSRTEQPIVADPYTFPVSVKEAGFIDALTARERIRSTGPTVRVRRPD
jgi:hypothetical protein